MLSGTIQATLPDVNEINSDVLVQIEGDAFAYSGTPRLVLTASHGVLTYQGPPVDAVCIASMSAKQGTDENAPGFFGISHNGDLLNVDPTSPQAVSAGVATTSLILSAFIDPQCLTSQRRITLQRGDRIQAVGCTRAGDGGIRVRGFSLTILMPFIPE